MTHAPHADRLRAGLAAALAVRRAGSEALARALLARDADGYVFVGVTADAARGVYYQPHEWAVRSIALDDGDLGSLHTGAVEADHVIRPADYVAARPAAAWAWLHPWFRWAVPED